MSIIDKVKEAVTGKKQDEKWSGNSWWREFVIKPFTAAINYSRSLGKRKLDLQQQKRARKNAKLRKVQKASRRRNRR